MVYWVCNKRLFYKIKFSRYLLKLIYILIFLLLSSSLNLTDIYCWYSLSSYNLKVNTLRKSLQTTSALPCRTQVQPAASFQVCSLIFVDKKKCSSKTEEHLLLWFWFGFCRLGVEFLVTWCLEKVSTGFTLSLAKETGWLTTFFLLNLLQNW